LIHTIGHAELAKTQGEIVQKSGWLAIGPRFHKEPKHLRSSTVFIPFPLVSVASYMSRDLSTTVTALRPRLVSSAGRYSISCKRLCDSITHTDPLPHSTAIARLLMLLRETNSPLCDYLSRLFRTDDEQVITNHFASGRNVVDPPWKAVPCHGSLLHRHRSIHFDTDDRRGQVSRRLKADSKTNVTSPLLLRTILGAGRDTDPFEHAGPPSVRNRTWAREVNRWRLKDLN
jgi:hypothetical protein